MSTVNVQIKNKIAKVTISRPKALNALSREVLEDLLKAFTDLSEQKDEIRGVLLTGEGDKAFVAGADIPSMKGMPALGADEFCQLGHCCLRVIETCPVPVVAAVNGFALGGGMELALACDFIYASKTACFGLPEVTLGLFPGFGGTQRLSRQIGMARAKELIYTGQKITAEKAYEWGIVNKLCEPADLVDDTQELLEKIAQNGPVAIKMAKRVINEGTDLPLASGLTLELGQFPLVFATDDVQEGVGAFLEKRKADFKGK